MGSTLKSKLCFIYSFHRDDVKRYSNKKKMSSHKLSNLVTKCEQAHIAVKLINSEPITFTTAEGTVKGEMKKRKSSFARRHFLFRRKWNYLDHSPESILNQRLLKAFACAFHGFIWGRRWLKGGRVTWFCHRGKLLEVVPSRQVKFVEKFAIIELQKFHDKLQNWTSSSLDIFSLLICSSFFHPYTYRPLTT
jgi:hypothetical protein